MMNSALRRNLCEHLGIAGAKDLKNGRDLPTADDAKRVTHWLATCEFAWIECKTQAVAGSWTAS
jgi:hypothetical protein